MPRRLLPNCLIERERFSFIPRGGGKGLDLSLFKVPPLWEKDELDNGGEGGELPFILRFRRRLHQASSFSAPSVCVARSYTTAHTVSERRRGVKREKNRMVYRTQEGASVQTGSPFILAHTRFGRRRRRIGAFGHNWQVSFGARLSV